MLRLFRPSGGLLYHWRAFRSRAGWHDFTLALETFLHGWTKPAGPLVLLGPSGGYTLPSTWLAGFDVIHAYDLDPLAPYFFGLSHRGVHAEFHLEDVFWRDGRLSTTGVENVVRTHPGATILFCNVLGQLPLENALNEEDFARYLRQMRASLQDARWASYHDLFTVEGANDHDHSEIVKSFVASGEVGKFSPSAPKVEVIDHLLQGEWSHGLARSYSAWPLTKSSLHLIESVHA